MAQGSKSRIIIWTIVGILVVVAVILVVTGRKGTAGGSPTGREYADPAKFAETWGTKVERLDGKVAKAKADNLGTPDAFAKIDEGIAKARAALTELPGLTEAQAVKGKMEEVKSGYNDSKKLLREMTGKDDE